MKGSGMKTVAAKGKMPAKPKAAMPMPAGGKKSAPMKMAGKKLKEAMK